MDRALADWGQQPLFNQNRTGNCGTVERMLYRLLVDPSNDAALPVDGKGPRASLTGAVPQRPLSRSAWHTRPRAHVLGRRYRNATFRIEASGIGSRSR
jgi:hypothetical protein